jgi:hypothetical protein
MYYYDKALPGTTPPQAVQHPEELLPPHRNPCILSLDKTTGIEVKMQI